MPSFNPSIYEGKEAANEVEQTRCIANDVCMLSVRYVWFVKYTILGARVLCINKHVTIVLFDESFNHTVAVAY